MKQRFIMRYQITRKTFLNSKKKISLKVKEYSIGRIQEDRCGRHLMVGGFTLPVPIVIKVVSSNRAHGGMYSIQHFVMQFVSDL